jgi:hypothetical protein
MTDSKLERISDRIWFMTFEMRWMNSKIPESQPDDIYARKRVHENNDTCFLLTPVKREFFIDQIIILDIIYVYIYKLVYHGGR